MSKNIRRVALGVLCAILVACAVAVGVILGAFNKKQGVGGVSADGGATASGTAQAIKPTLNTNYDYEITLKGTAAQMAAGWDEAVSYTGKNVLVTLADNWTAVDSTDPQVVTDFLISRAISGTYGELYVPANVNITLDLNGYTLDKNATDKTAATNSGHVIWVCENAVLTVIDGSAGGTGTITGGHSGTHGGGIWVDGTLNMYGGTITGNVVDISNGKVGGVQIGSMGIGVFVCNGAFNMYGGKITDNKYLGAIATGVEVGGGGVGIYASIGTNTVFNMYGGEISDNKATWGGGIATHSTSATAYCTFNMYGGKISGNEVGGKKDAGGGVYPYKYSKMVMEGGEISGNKSLGGGGGGIALQNYAEFTMNGGKITDNQALSTSYSGGTSNKSNAGGGGIYLYDKSTAVMNGGEISYNYALEGGGVKLIQSSEFIMNGGIITRNNSMPGGWGSTGISAGYTNTSTTKCWVTLNGGQIVDNNKPYKDYAITEFAEGVTIAQYSLLYIGGPVIIANNGQENPGDNALAHDVWVYGANQISVTAPLYQNGQAAQIGIYVSSNVATTANIVTGVTAANLCGFHETSFFNCQNKDKTFSLVSNNLRLSAFTDGFIYFNWSYQTAEGWQQLDEGVLFAQLDYGERVTAVKAECTDSAGTNLLFSWPSGTGGGTAFSKTGSYIDNVEATSITDISKVGIYTFSVDMNSVSAVQYVWHGAFRIEIVPKDITVVINNDSVMYGESISLNQGFNNTPEADGSVKGGWQLADGCALAGSDGYADLGIALSKLDYGYNVRNYTITGKSTAKNYNVTFVNASLAITPRPVTIILHDDMAQYGDTVALTQKPVTTKYDNGTPDDATDDWYKGGWRYADGSKQIVAGDIVDNKYPLALSSTAVVTSGYTAVGEYPIIATFTNANYTVTLLNSDGTAPAAGNNASGTFTVTGAAIAVKSATDYDSTNLYNKAQYNGSAHNLVIPDGAIVLKAGVTTSVKKYKVFAAGDSNIPATTPAATDTTFWSDAVTGPVATDAGEYRVYTLITAVNHEPMVHVWTFKIEKSKAAFKLTAKFGTATVAANGKVTYDGATAVVVSLTFTTSGATATTCPYKIYYKGDGNNYGTAADPTYKDDSKDKDNNSLGLGSSTAPKEAGKYKATVIADPTASSSFELDSSCDSTFVYTIEAKTVSVPTAAFATGSGTYNGSAQTVNYTYNTAAVKITSCTGVTDGDVTYGDLTQGASTNVSGNTSTSFTATNAGDYAVEFDLTSTRNFKWDDSDNPAGAQIVSCTVKKAQLDFTLVSPVKKDGTEVWQWDAGTTAEKGITAKENSLTGLVSGDTVTFNVSWYKYSGGAAGTRHLVNSGVEYTDINVSIASFDEQASYFILIQTAAGDSSNANDNYCLKQDDTHFTPKLEGVKYKEIVVGAGKVDVSRIIWQWQLEGSGADPVNYVKNAESADDNTKLIYTASNAGFVWTALSYVITADLSDLDYLEIDTSKGADGYEISATYGNKYSGAGTYKTRIYLKIKDGSSYEFDVGDKSTYDAGTAKTASVDFEWEIAKREISFVDESGSSLVKWAFSTDAKSSAGGELDPNATWTEFSSGAKPAYTEARIYVKISDEWLNSLGLSTAAGQIEVKYNNSNFQTAAKTTKQTTYTITLKGDNAKNYTIATGENVGTFEWEIGYAQIKVAGWGGTRDVYDEVTEKSFTLPAADVSAEHEGKIEYRYSYDILDENNIVIGHKDDVDEATMIADLYPVADESHPNTTLKVKPVIKSGESYDIVFESGINEEESATIGEMKTSVTVELVGTGSQYGDVKFEVIATYYPDNDISLSIKDFIGSRGQYLKITITGPEGNIAEMTANDLSKAFEILKDAGTYTVRFEIIDADTKAEFALKKSKFDFVVSPKQIAIPEITGEIIFEGQNIDLKTRLDVNYAEYSDKEIVVWTAYDTDCYHVGKYTATLTVVNANYVWADPDETSAAIKALARYSAADEVITVSDKINANYTWEIKPYVLSGSNLWNTSGGEGANLNLPEFALRLIEEEKLGIEYVYRTDKASPAVEPEWKGGNSYYVSATLNGADAKDFVFENGTIGSNGSPVSEMVSYTVPQNGMKAFFSNAGKFIKDNWLWFVIGGAILLFLILLIIIIAAAKKKKKKKLAEEEKKREKEEAKAVAAAAAGMPVAAAASLAMADEKAKLEAEKAKMEAELAKAKAQAELDLQKAKAEAEIAKMRADAEAQAKQAQAQQVQQPAVQQMQQPVQQLAQQPQSNVDVSVIAELKAELAALRAAQHNAPYPSPAPYNGGDAGALAKIEAEIAAMRSEQRVLREAELKASQEVAVEKMKTELARFRADSQFAGYSQHSVSPEMQNAMASGNMPAIPANLVGALILSAMNMTKQPAQPSEQPPQEIAAESQSGAVNTPTMYPPDAVITTTTTVDTTTRAKEQNGRNEGRDNRDDIFDIDGFYDKFEGNK